MKIEPSASGFFQYIALPLYQTMAAAVPAVEPMLMQVLSNLAYWTAQEASCEL